MRFNNRYGLIQTLFRQSSLFEQWVETNSESLEMAPTLRLPALVTLLKFADGQVHSDSKPSAIEPGEVISTFRVLVRDEVTQLFDSTHSFSISETNNIATCVQLLLGMLETLLDPESGPEILARDSCELAEVLVGMKHLDFD
jgi:hypothetical protein